jgi:hypothetical protein
MTQLKKSVVPALALVLCLPIFAGGQDIQPPESWLSIGNTCESNIARLDNWDSKAGDELVIAIARLGAGERERVLNRRRLHNVRLYLETVRGRDPKKIVTAEGESARGRGRVEIYVGGKLVDVMGMGRNEDFAAGSCDGTSKSDPLYFSRRARRVR